MFTCPNCQTALQRIMGKSGIFWYCPACKGRAVTLELLRKIISGDTIKKLWQRTIQGGYPQKRKCPSCGNLMAEVPIINSENTLYLDVCKRCHFVWFDQNEHQQLPKIKQQAKITDKLTMEQREKLALAQLELYKANRDIENTLAPLSDENENWIQSLCGILGLPVECDGNEIESRPLITWGLSAIIAAVSITAFFFHLEQIVNNWGLIPEYFYRHLGLTFISSFFLHGDVFHLVGNLYFLFIFGDNVEDFLGRYKYIVLIILAAFVGDITHILSDPHSLTPCIGASGGISGIITYYALRFPHNKISMVFGPGLQYGYRLGLSRIRLPAIFLFVLWMLIQTYGAIEQVRGFNNVSSLAHLGGVAAVLFSGFILGPKNKAPE